MKFHGLSKQSDEFSSDLEDYCYYYSARIALFKQFLYLANYYSEAINTARVAWAMKAGFTDATAAMSPDD